MPYLSIIYAKVQIAQNFGSPFGVSLGLNDLVSLILQIAIVIAGVILLFLLVGSGIQMIHGAGNSDPKATAGAHNAMTYAIAGFILILFAYVIIRIIESILGVNFFTQPIPGAQAP
jgi:hypothetical protein